MILNFPQSHCDKSCAQILFCETSIGIDVYTSGDNKVWNAWKKAEDCYFNLEMHAFMLGTLVLSTAITERPMKDSSYITSTTILQTVSCEHCTQEVLILHKKVLASLF